MTRTIHRRALDSEGAGFAQSADVESLRDQIADTGVARLAARAGVGVGVGV